MKPFGLLHEKYWPDQYIIYFCDKKVIDLPSNIIVKEIRGLNGSWDWNNPNSFTYGMKNALLSISDQIVMVSMCDMWPTAPVQADIIKSLEEYMIQTKLKILRISVGHEWGPHWQCILANDETTKDITTIDIWNDLEIRSCSPTNIHIGLCAGFLFWPSIWNKDLLLKTMIQTTWCDFESDNTQKLIGTDIRGAWILPSSIIKAGWKSDIIYKYMHATGRDKKTTVMLGHLNDEDIKIVKANVPPNITYFNSRES